MSVGGVVSMTAIACRGRSTSGSARLWCTWPRRAPLWRTLLWVVVLTGVCGSRGWAQTVAPPIPTPQIFYSNVQPLTDVIAQTKTDPRPTSADGALQIYNWLVYGSVGVSGVYDNNINSSPVDPIAAYGTQVTPSVIAEYNTGIQRTFIYGVGDFRYYPSVNQAQIWDSSAGIVHIWEIDRGLNFRAQAQLTDGESPLGYTNVGTNAVVAIEPVQAVTLFGSTSIQRDVGLFFTALGGSVTYQTFNQTQTVDTDIAVPESYRDGATYTVNGRLGYNVTPLVYAYVEPSINTAQFNDSSLDSQGYRVVAGLGSARVGLMNGEIYGGFMDQTFADPSIAPLTTGVYGGHLSYYPTRSLSFTASLDQGLNTSDYSTRSFLPGSIVKTNTAKLQANWDVTRFITLSGSVQYSQWDYLGSTLVQDYLTGSSSLTYWIQPKLGITLQYSHSILDTNLVGGNYTHDFVSLGAKGRF